MSLPNATKPLLLASPAAGYQVSRSLRFNSADSAYLNRTPASNGDRQTWTWSGWVKRSGFGTQDGIVSGFQDNTNRTHVFFETNNKIRWYSGTGGDISTVAVFRDASAWMHLVVVLNATSSPTLLIYVNGVLQALSGTYPSSSTNAIINSANIQTIGTNFYASAPDGLSDCYLSEIHFIDGQALTPSSFAETDATTGQWVPKSYTGSYGTNGFKLTFADNSAATAATLGADSSGNANNFTPTNLSVTAGVNNDSLTDTPTQYGSDTGVGGEVRGNYATLNPLLNGNGTPSNGNLLLTGPTGAWGSRAGTVAVSSGKWYFEVTATSGALSQGVMIGITKALPATNHLGIDANGYAYFSATGNKWNNGSPTAYGATWTDNDVIGCAFDADAGTLVFYKNGTSQGTAYSSLSSTIWFLGLSCYGTATAYINFGQRAFTYTAPSGYKALCVQNLSTPTIVLPSTAFDAKLYTGTGSSQSITGLGFNPDLVWIKSRSAATDNTLYDSVRGAQARLESNTTDTEVTADNGLTAFDATGFTVNTLAQVNTSAATYVGWCWDESVSAGFDIVTYAGNGTAGRAISHSLGVTPAMILIFNRTSSYQARVFHQSLGASKNLTIQTTDGDGSTSSERVTAVSSSTFTVSGGIPVNGTSNNYVSYLWAEVAGFSKFGSYTGNGSADGPFVHCGFKPRFVMVKRTDMGGEDWMILDTARDTVNVSDRRLLPSSSSAELNNGNGATDIASNGFKVRTSASNINASSGNYIFMAFAEAPFKYANAR